MKFLISILFAFPSLSLAGNGSGGVGTRPGMGAMNMQMVRFEHFDGENIYADFATSQGTRWHTQKIVIPAKSIVDPSLQSAIETSIDANDWAPLK